MTRMIVPRFWAEGRIQERGPRGQVTVRRWGWSDESPEDAQAKADRRAREAFEQVRTDQSLPRREPKVPYNGAKGVPIREEIVSRHGETLVTRNSYGALCLNTPDVLFVDVDFRDPVVPSFRLFLAAAFLSATTALLAAPSNRLLWGLGATLGALVGVWLAGALLNRILLLRCGSREGYAHARIVRFAERRPDWRIRVYRTPAGFRVLVLHRRFDPTSAEVAAVFEELRADPVYARLCRLQHCFRARVSPKPWRIGIAAHLRPRPGVWPVSPDRLPERARWLADYDRAAQAYASCSHVETLGRGTEDPETAAVRALHDELSRALSGLPAA
jgi:hypothetical protein